MNEFEFMLEDRIAKIQAINEQYDLEHNAYISFSGGKDSTVLHYLIDLALPNNNIPRIFMNTGIEYLEIVKFVKKLAKEDDRFVLISPTKNIKKTLETYGYPFKSKEFSQIVERFKRLGKTKSVSRYLELDGMLGLTDKLRYIFDEKNNVNLKISDKCCLKMKEEPLSKYQKDNNKTIAIIGITGDDKGRRNSYKNNHCLKNYNNSIKFYPLRVVDESFENWFLKIYKIKLCKLYYPPYNFKRTGCKGCPFDKFLQKDLDILEKFFPNEYKQCETIWKPVYDEYRRIGYRLRKNGYKQLSLFDEEE